MKNSPQIALDWELILKLEFKKDYFFKMKNILENEYRNKQIYPLKREILRAFELTSYKNVKIVILGQDPYYRENQAHGLAFSVRKGVNIPPSLKNIYKEIKNENEGEIFKHGNLESWSKQGVFLLNTSLTVEEGKPNSHSGIGWSIFTDNIIKNLNEKKEPVIFVLWGNNAKSKKRLITNKNHIILEGVHPSPLSASRGFFGCNHFKTINKILQERGEKEIDWNIL